MAHFLGTVVASEALHAHAGWGLAKSAEQPGDEVD